MRSSSRKNNELRKIELIANVNKYADGSCLAIFGDTKVMCTATIENRVPPFLKHTGTGWVTAEYGMLPGSCRERVDREASRGKQGGRTMEIQRLIGRSLRSVVDLEKLGERQIIIDCDVIQADGGTRTAAITGGYIALYQAIKKLKFKQKWETLPITDAVAAVSCGIVNNELMLDLDFEEDSHAETDSNFVMTESGGIVEIQSTAEKVPFTEHEFTKLLNYARAGIIELFKKQKEALTEKSSDNSSNKSKEKLESIINAALAGKKIKKEQEVPENIGNLIDPTKPYAEE